jgi:hypothetical protein
MELAKPPASHRQVWNPATDIDWRIAPARPRWLPRRNHVVLVSQFLHGEAAALAVCRRLALTSDGADRAALDQQSADEARHVEAFRLYLARLGDTSPPTLALARVLEGIAGWHGSSAGILLGNHVLLEGEALAGLRELATRYPCPLLRQVTRRVMRDEARHVALGRGLLRRAVAELSQDERVDLYGWLRGLWHAGVRAAARDHGGVVFGRVRPPDAIASRWARQRRALVRLRLIDDAHPAFAN